MDFLEPKRGQGPVRITTEVPLDGLPLYVEAHDRALLAVLKKVSKCF